MAKTQNADNTKCKQGYGTTGALAHSCWECKMIQPVWDTEATFLHWGGEAQFIIFPKRKPAQAPTAGAEVHWGLTLAEKPSQSPQTP